jgi:glycosyltransferase involved in cell wall biosynthesis
MLVKQRELGVEQRFMSYDPCTSFARSFTDTTDPERIMAEIEPDLVYFSYCCPLSNIAAKHVAITKKIPFAVISHSAADYLAQRFPACLPTVKGQLQKASDVIAISQKNLDILRSHFGLASDKGHVVLNGRPASFFSPFDPVVRQRIRTELNIPADAVLCFTSARFDLAKGYQHQLAAIQQLQIQKALGKLYFIWAGTGDHHTEFVQTITKLGLDSRIRLLGQRWDIADLLDASDLFVLTTMLEGGLPLSVMEAMAKGVATIVTSVSGIAGVSEGACQLLPDPNTHPNDTVRMLANSLETLARDPARRATLSQAGRTLADRRFRQETNLSQTLAILEAILPPPSAVPKSANVMASIPSPEPHAPAVSAFSYAAKPKESFVLKPDFSGQEWRKIVLAYIRAFSPSDPVGLLIQRDASQKGSLTQADVQEKVQELVRLSGKAAFADIVLCQNSEDLAATLQSYTVIHHLPFSAKSYTKHTAASKLLLTSLTTTRNPPVFSPPARLPHHSSGPLLQSHHPSDS